MKTLQAYRFALDPNNAQAAALLRHAGAARFAFNWGLARVKAALAQRDAERTYGIPDTELTEIPWTLYALRKEWNRAKDDVAPWWRECSKEAFSAGLDQLARGLKNFTDSRHGKRKGRRVGFPRFRKRGRCRAAFRYTTGAFGPDGDKHVKLPRIGRVRVCEAMGTLTQKIADGRARVLGATVSRTAGRWYVAFTVELDRAVPAPSGRQRRNGAVGVDLGVADLAVLSTGEKIPNPRHLARSLRRLRRASRAYARTRPGSARRARRAARLGRIHARIACQRRDGLHKLTTRLAKDYHTVVVEDLNVAGMVTNRRLARSIADTGMAEVRRHLSYKTGWYGSALHVADRWYPSSKTCAACGWRNPSLTLADRMFTCADCGLVVDRDRNAALNLRHLVAGSGPETVNARGADQKTPRAGRVALKREPCAATAGCQTGTVTRQRVTTIMKLTHAS